MLQTLFNGKIAAKNISLEAIFNILETSIRKGENIGKWPLYIMLSAAIVCFGFSTSFHWFSIYSKNLFLVLSRLDYAGITFLIPGSCYPPYFYFYYCEKCKKFKFNY